MIDFFFHDDIPLVQHLKKWITQELHRNVEDVTRVGVQTEMFPYGVSPEGYKRFTPSSTTTFELIFNDTSKYSVTLFSFV